MDSLMTETLLTADEVMAAMDKYFETGGNPVLQPLMRDYYAQTGKIPHAVLVTLKLEKITLIRVKDAR
jgi:hypothetical protein